MPTYLPAYISLSSVLDWTIVFIILSIMWNIAASSKILRECGHKKMYLFANLVILPAQTKYQEDEVRH